MGTVRVTDANQRAFGPRGTTDVSAPVRVVLGVLAAAAGIIHLAMVPSHWSESVVEGVAFAAAGWFQLALAVGLVVRPVALLVRIAIVANVAFLGAWAVSRTWGLPYGAHAGHPHEAGFVDLACVGIELAFVTLAIYALLHPAVGRTWRGARLAVLTVVPMAVIALATAALASPSARDHAGDSHGTHGHTHEVAAARTADAGHADGTADGDGTAHDVSVADHKSGWAALGENGHQHGEGVVELDRATRAAWSVQLAQTTRLIEKYPTVAAAEAAGFRRQGRFNPGLGTHYGGGGSGDDVIVGVDGIAMVPTLIYDGTDPDSPIAGFMYLAPGSGDQVPEGFVGPNDHWHKHTNLCIKFDAGRIIALGNDDPSMTQERCSKLGGMYIQRSGYMVHVWTVPGYESPDGVFSGLNRKLTCPDGTYHKAPEGGGSDTSTCAVADVGVTGARTSVRR